MHFSEDDLRRALERKDPGTSFTQRVMARINQAEAKTHASPKLRTPFQRWWWRVTLRPVLAGAIVVVLAIGGWLGLLQYQRIQEKRAGERAKEQAIMALRITNAKLNHVFQRVNASPSHENKNRRDQL